MPACGREWSRSDEDDQGVDGDGTDNADVPPARRSALNPGASAPGPSLALLSIRALRVRVGSLIKATKALVSDVTRASTVLACLLP